MCPHDCVAAGGSCVSLLVISHEVFPMYPLVFGRYRRCVHRAGVTSVDTPSFPLRPSGLLALRPGRELFYSIVFSVVLFSFAYFLLELGGPCCVQSGEDC